MAMRITAWWDHRDATLQEATQVFEEMEVATGDEARGSRLFIAFYIIDLLRRWHTPGKFTVSPEARAFDEVDEFLALISEVWEASQRKL